MLFEFNILLRQMHFKNIQNELAPADKFLNNSVPALLKN